MSTKIDQGGPAFPFPKDADEWGMSLRDHFAGQALQVVLHQSESFPAPHLCNAIARTSYEIADAMIRAREGDAQ